MLVFSVALYFHTLSLTDNPLGSLVAVCSLGESSALQYLFHCVFHKSYRLCSLLTLLLAFAGFGSYT